MARRRTTTKKKKTDSGFSIRPEFVGLVLLALALLTFLSLFSPTRGSLTSAFLDFLERMVGWGRYIIWFFFASLGWWFIRRFGAEDQDEKWEKPVGTVLLFGMLLIIFQLFSPVSDPIATGRTGGGGLIGWLMGQLLISAMGVEGTIVVLLFLICVTAIMISGLSFRELITIVRDNYYRLQDYRNPSDHLRDKRDHQSASPYVAPSRSTRDTFVKCFVQQTAHSRTMIKPIDEISQR
jgi:hypothetical protein